MLSWFIQTTSVPTGTVSTSGVNAKCAMITWGLGAAGLAPIWAAAADGSNTPEKTPLAQSAAPPHITAIAPPATARRVSRIVSGCRATFSPRLLMSSSTVACSSLYWGIPTVTALIQRKPIVRFRRAEHIVEITEGGTEFVSQERTRRSQYSP